jgi:benzoyl-CoA-dihydrodiol lyase
VRSTAPAHRHLHRQGARRAAAGDIAGIEAAGAAWYPLAMARELDDAILSMRTNELDIGTWLIKTEGDAAAVLAMDATLPREPRPLAGARDDRPAAPHAQPAGRVLAQPVRADRARLVLRRHLLELALACDRSYMLALPDEPARAPSDHRGRALNFGRLPDGHRPEPPAAPLLRRQPALDAVREQAWASALDADAALCARPGHQRNPDDIDWADETRIAIEERVAMSPDALTGMEANLRFNGQREHLHPRLRPPDRLAELDLPAAQRGRREGRAQGLRQGRQAAFPRLEPPCGSRV